MNRRWTRRLALLLLLALAVTPLLLLSTNTGARWGLSLLERRLPLQAQGVAGSLLHGLEIDQLRYRDTGVDVSASSLALAINWRCTLRGSLCIDALALRELLLATRGESDSGGSPEALLEALPWPLPLRVRELQIARLVLSADGVEREVTDLRLGLQPRTRSVDIAPLAGAFEGVSWSGSGSLLRSGAWSLALTVDPSEALGPGLPETLRSAYDLEMNGELLQGLRLSAVSQRFSDVVLSAAVTLPAEGSALNVEARLSGAAQLVPALAQSPWTQLSGPFELRAEQATDGLKLAVEQGLLGYADGVSMLRLALRERAGSWILERASLGAREAPLLLASGELGRADAWSPRLAVELRNFSTPADTGPRVTAGNGSLQLGLAASDPLQTWRIASDGLRLQLDDRDLALRGDLEAAADAVWWPVGVANVVYDAREVEYRRAQAESPVTLRLLRGLQLGEFALHRVEAEVTPGPRTVVRVDTAGDLSTLLEVTLQQTQAGAGVRLAPFTLHYGEQQIVSEAPISGDWDRASSSLSLAQFCLRWRDNRACSDALALGESGELSMALSADDRIDGSINGKPYTVAGRGEGTLEARWQDAQLTHAALALSLQDLLFDPFDDAQTAAPVLWEIVELGASYTPGESTLRAILDSSSAGVIDTEVVERGGSLAGRARLGSLDLQAFDDFLPELSMDGGELSGELLLAGTRESPRLDGELVLRDGSVLVQAMDTRIDDIRLRARANTTSLTLDGEAMLGGGPLSLSGACCENASLQLSVTGTRNQLRLPQGLDASVSPVLDLQLSAGQARIGGEVIVHDGVFELQGPVSGGVALSSDVVRVDLPSAPPRRFDVLAQLRTLIEPGFTLRSKEIEATLGGDLRINRGAGGPLEVYGSMQVLGGELRALGQALRLTDGSVGFVGDPLNPDLDISAERVIRAEQQRVGFRVRGTLNEPLFTLFSDPQRSERDTLSYLLRGRGPDAGAAADSTAMALSLGASAINQTGLLNALNDIPGLSGVTVGAQGGEDNTAATVSAYVGSRLYLSYGIGLYEPVNALTARLYLRSRLWLEVISSLESSFDLYYRFDRN